MRSLVVCLLALISSQVLASDKEVTINFGSGVFKSGESSLAETKLLLIGYENYFYKRNLFFRNELGGFVDVAGNGRRSSFLGGSLLGVNAENSVFYAKGAAGFNLLSSPDSYLGGPIQFTEEVEFGVNGLTHSHVGVFYKHVSSGGVYQPNVGRDFIGATISIPF